jgi:predicted nucleotidyltransferase
MYEHHRLTIENLRNHYEQNRDNIAFIVNGSVARGEAGKESGLDYWLVVEDEVFAELSAKNSVSLEANEYEIKQTLRMIQKWNNNLYCTTLSKTI